MVNFWDMTPDELQAECERYPDYQDFKRECIVLRQEAANELCMNDEEFSKHVQNKYLNEKKIELLKKTCSFQNQQQNLTH